MTIATCADLKAAIAAFLVIHITLAMLVPKSLRALILGR